MGEVIFFLMFVALAVGITVKVVRYYDRAEIQQAKRDMQTQVDEIKKVTAKYDRDKLVAGVRAPRDSEDRN